ncbi:T9SS type A sorting domain-containing protein [Chryseobacterium indologenes]|uniref:T9SS type A sorting domain-containing protein n=1 Tax=Chryseobacterium indologenes TaxID=253 RepID=UPI0009EA6B6F|nr:T9SS type A sorting domain-containing protein [Chryseobacterium indologenes]
MIQYLYFVMHKAGRCLVALITLGSFAYGQQASLTSKDCNNTDPGNTPGDTGCVTFTYQGQQVTYTTVRGNDGKIWLQQNLGSSQVAVDKADAASYGDLFQWGRWDDGHQLRSSVIMAAPDENFPSGLAGSSSYIAGDPVWWAEFQGGDQWNASDLGNVTPGRGIDPCKAVGPGWQMPTQSEWEMVAGAENINNPTSAYNSHLKLPASGYRNSGNGGFTFVGQRGYFWSSDTSTLGAKYLYVGTVIANASAGAPRGQGAAVRCIKTGPVLGISETLRKDAVGIYPNPVKNILTIKADTLMESVNVFNMTGQKINISFSGNQINMNDLPNGNYIIELILKNGQRLSKKVIKN